MVLSRRVSRVLSTFMLSDAANNAESKLDFAQRPRTILVGFDGRDESMYALIWTFTCIMEKGDTLAVVSCVKENQTIYGAEEAEVVANIQHQQALRKEQKVIDELLLPAVKPLKARFAPDNDQINVYACLGDPKKKIIEMAKELNAAMIIVGCRGKSDTKSILSGVSVSHHLLHASPIPVIVARIPVQIIQDKKEKVEALVA